MQVLGSVRRQVPAIAVVLIPLIVTGAFAVPGAYAASSKGGLKTSATTHSSVSVSSPTSGATVSGTVPVSGTANDHVAVAAVAVSIDNEAWQTTTGTIIRH